MLLSQTLLELLGKNRSSPDFSRLLVQINTEPVYAPAAHMVFHKFQEQGISLMFDRNFGAFTGVFLYIVQAENFSKYHGDLPYGLQTTDNRMDVRRKLGEPTRVIKRGKVLSYLFDLTPYLISFEFDRETSELKQVCLMLREACLDALGSK